MKFLCMECNQPMKLYEVSPPEDGSLAVRYECPECLHQIAMLTNAHETQVVTSLGVQIGPGKAAAGAGGGAEAPPAEGSGCPFGAMVAEASAGAEAAGDRPVQATVEAPAEAAPADGPMSWTDEARARLDRIPSFVRPMAVTGIERYAREQGYPRVDEAVLDEAKDHFGM